MKGVGDVRIDPERITRLTRPQLHHFAALLAIVLISHRDYFFLAGFLVAFFFAAAGFFEELALYFITISIKFEYSNKIHRNRLGGACHGTS